MAKARSAPSGPRAPRPALPTAGTGRVGLTGYFRGVWEELKKVVWPTRDELLRMTGIVIATVLLFAVIIGGADYILSLGVKQAVTQQAAATTPLPTTVPVTTPVPTAVPTVTPSVSP